MLISSTYKDLLAPAHNLSGPKIQHVNRDVHWYKQHVVHKHYINTELGKPNAHNILQHIYTLFVSSITSTPTVWPFQHQVFEVFHARTVPPPGVCPNKINIPYPHLDILNTESHYRGYLACPPRWPKWLSRTRHQIKTWARGEYIFSVSTHFQGSETVHNKMKCV